LDKVPAVGGVALAGVTHCGGISGFNAILIGVDFGGYGLVLEIDKADSSCRESDDGKKD
jgi:hypothetical protein